VGKNRVLTQVFKMIQIMKLQFIKFFLLITVLCVANSFGQPTFKQPLPEIQLKMIKPLGHLSEKNHPTNNNGLISLQAR
jgi:hypothetical protein